ncbi:MAG: HIT family protein [Defluviitaleaceae bacterium]|nr:HIT family protein [Defluviitaleaceae bacterium]
MNDNCLFCKIINGDLPSYKLYEDNLFYVMLDKFPQSVGHTLILTKRHAANIFELTEQETCGVFTLAQKFATAISQQLAVQNFNIVQNNGKAAGQEIDHFHLHIIPRYTGNAKKSAALTDDDFSELLAKLKMQ